MAAIMKPVLYALLASATCALQVAAQTGASATLSTPPITNSTRTPTTTSSIATGSAPDVYLNVPTLSVGRIELDVDNLQADINLNANVAQLVTINAGVQVGKCRGATSSVLVVAD